MHNVRNESKGGVLIRELASEKPERGKRGIGLKKEFENEVHGDPFLLNGFKGFHSQVAVRELLSRKGVSM